MKIGVVRRARPVSDRDPRGPLKGFTMLEVTIVVAVMMVMMLIAIPLVRNVQGTLKLRGAVSAVTGTIQTVRYQAIFQGCNTQVVFDSVALTAQAQTTQLPGPAGGCSVAPAPPSFLCKGVPWPNPCAIPLSGSGNRVTLNLSQTLTFNPGGRVLVAGGPAGCPCTMVLTYAAKTATIRISSFGSTNVTYAP